jgi:hypothetical protein
MANQIEVRDALQDEGRPGAARTSNVTRKTTSPIKVYCLPAERAELKSLARAANQSVSTYLLNVGLGYEVRGVVDHRQVEELARINGDLGRLGGLLKLWLTNDERTAQFGESTIRTLLARIESTQTDMQAAIRAVVLPNKRSQKI